MDCDIKLQADQLLYDCGLYRELSKYGNTCPIGSYYMDLMARNDLDLYVDSDGICMDDIYVLVDHIIHTYKPVWFEAREGDEDGQAYWFVGFETMILGELWNVDIRFISNSDIQQAIAYNDSIIEFVKSNKEAKETIVSIKNQLLKDKLYPDQINSMNVYHAVKNDAIKSVNAFYETYKLNPSC